MLQMQRRHSMAQSDGTSSPGTPLPQDNTMRPPLSKAGSNVQPGTLLHPMFLNEHMQGQMSSQFQFGGYQNTMSTFDPSNQMKSPLTTNMPVESQQILGNGAFDPSNPYTNFFMSQSHGMPISQGVGYTYNPNLSSSKKRQSSQSEGINQTLSQTPMSSSPSKIDTNVDNMATSNLSTNPINASAAESLSSQYVQNMHFDSAFGLNLDFSRSPGGGTPMNEGHGDASFADWIAENDEA